MNNHDFDKELSALFAGEEACYNEQKHEEMIREASKMYSSKTKRAKHLTWGSITVATGLILLCAWQFMQTSNMKTMLLTVMLILIFHEATVLMKLWWWTYSSRNITLESLKSIQLQLAEIQATITARGTGQEKTE